jgi:hypothetical protein
MGCLSCTRGLLNATETGKREFLSQLNEIILKKILDVLPAVRSEPYKPAII